jgi:hypothetical protein
MIECKCGCGELIPKRDNIAYVSGHRPKPKMIECKCGCGELISESRRHMYVSGHYKPKIIECKCGCGELIPKSSTVYVSGHRKPIMIECRCGCGELMVKAGGRRYIIGHSRKKLLEKTTSVDSPTNICVMDDEVKNIVDYLGINTRSF